MTSKYTKTYGRKKGNASQITQFDQLLGDTKKTTHPIASKTAGHVGKWGTTSFTSLRSINGGYGNQDSQKRIRNEYEFVASSNGDPFALEDCPTTEVNEEIKEVKRRKFFKSRDQSSCSQHSNSSSMSGLPKNASTEKVPSSSDMHDCDTSLKMPSKLACSSIKLKIYKSKNTETTDIYSSAVEIPLEESSASYGSHSSSPASVIDLHASEPAIPLDEISTASDLPFSLSPKSDIREEFSLSSAVSSVKPPPSPDKLLHDKCTDLESEDLHSANDEISLTTSSQSKNTDLFSTDFDEDEVVDRTEIDYFDNNIEESGSQCVNSTSDLLGLPSTEEFLPPDEKSESVDVPIFSKKRSIFKSRQTDGDSKKRAMYRHKWHSHDEKDESSEPKLIASKSLSNPMESTPPLQCDSTPSLQRVQTWPSAQLYDDFEDDFQPKTRVKCTKGSKQYYTVIKNVKKTHQLQESGEFQEFNDDVDYFLDALRSSNAISTRCLASLNLAQKCMTPAFRMHLRAHGTVIKFFRALTDAPTNQQLGESVALVMFILSQDHLNMDLDRESLELMLNLLDTDGLHESDSSTTSLDTHKKINQLCKELQQKGYAKHLQLDNVNAATLAMETLLSLTSKRAGEWFKEELRTLGGVDHLMRTVNECCDYFSTEISTWDVTLLEKLSKTERCLKVLENVTLQNSTNQEYLLTQLNKTFSSTLMKLFQLSIIEVPIYASNGDPDTSTCKALISCHITTMKVLINLTHGSGKEALGSALLGSDQQIYELALNCLLILPSYLEHDTKFEIQVLSCCLLLNLIENSPQNRATLMNMRAPATLSVNSDNLEYAPQETAMEALVNLFDTSNSSALEQEAHTDQIIDQDLDQDAQEEEKKDEDIADTVARLLQKAGRHMEDTLIAAYTALLAGFCIMDNEEYIEQVRCLLPNKNFQSMVAVLKKFLHFMKLTATTSLLRSLKPTEKVVKFMESLDKSTEKETT